ncbi:MAG: hypothetical protein M9918_24670 [Anaerolineae bacterium]|nr:hypothetical protein [Anaerolineae bacterium]
MIEHPLLTLTPNTIFDGGINDVLRAMLNGEPLTQFDDGLLALTAGEMSACITFASAEIEFMQTVLSDGNRLVNQLLAHLGKCEP